MEQATNWADADYWITKDGRILYPEQMGDEHLDNTIAFLENRLGIKEVDVWWGDEITQYRFFRSLQRYLAQTCHIYSLLIAERDKRKTMK